MKGGHDCLHPHGVACLRLSKRQLLRVVRVHPHCVVHLQPSTPLSLAVRDGDGRRVARVRVGVGRARRAARRHAQPRPRRRRRRLPANGVYSGACARVRRVICPPPACEQALAGHRARRVEYRAAAVAVHRQALPEAVASAPPLLRHAQPLRARRRGPPRPLRLLLLRHHAQRARRRGRRRLGRRRVLQDALPAQGPLLRRLGAAGLPLRVRAQPRLLRGVERGGRLGGARRRRRDGRRGRRARPLRRAAEPAAGGAGRGRGTRGERRRPVVRADRLAPLRRGRTGRRRVRGGGGGERDAPVWVCGARGVGLEGGAPGQVRPLRNGAHGERARVLHGDEAGLAAGALLRADAAAAAARRPPGRGHGAVAVRCERRRGGRGGGLRGALPVDGQQAPEDLNARALDGVAQLVVLHQRLQRLQRYEHELLRRELVRRKAHELLPRRLRHRRSRRAAHRVRRVVCRARHRVGGVAVAGAGGAAARAASLRRRRGPRRRRPRRRRPRRRRPR
eukprot:Rhum_TRINITY_DN13966_c8_g1::Rhum_TRINITY_DN13966_c8_g1_i1::g.66612::m.66612